MLYIPLHALEISISAGGEALEERFFTMVLIFFGLIFLLAASQHAERWYQESSLPQYWSAFVRMIGGKA